MKTKIFLLGAATLLLSACQDELQQLDNQALGGGNSTLSINVVTENIESKGLVTGNYLDSGKAIGVTVTNTSGGNYDNTAYNNIKFTSSGTGTSQTWSGASTVKLSATEGYCYAYYPYSSSASSITAIPVTAGGTDYLYATKVSVNDKSKTASLTMKHALSAIRFALKKGTYTGTGKVTAVSVTSAALGSSGTLNATTGAVTAANKGTAVSQTTSLTLNGNAQNVDVVMVPSGSAGTITLSVTIDGKAYSTMVSSTTIAQGSCYTYTITVNAGSLALSGVQVGAWGYNSAGAPTITAAGYTVTFAGNYSGIAFENSVSGSNVTIKAINVEGYPVKAVTTSGTATLSQSVSGMVRTITLSGVGSNVTVNFNGYATPPAAIADSWSGLSDGVYAIRPDNKPAYASDGNEACGVAIVMKGKAYQIAKVDATGYNGSYSVYWDKNNSTDIALTNYTTVDGTSGRTYGYLAGTSSPQLSRDPSTWVEGALSDFNGQANTATILSAQNNGEDDYTIGKAVMDFRNGSNNEGKEDWFVPSCGELAYMFLMKTELNTLLGKINGGSTIINDWYWSSSEYRSDGAWFVGFSDGFVDYINKNYYNRVRLVRAI